MASVKGRNANRKKQKKKKVESEMDEEASLSDLENSTLSDHKKQLAEIAEIDPEFYKFLKEQDADLLQFGESESEEEEEEEEEDEDLEGVGSSEGPAEEEGLRRDASGRKIIGPNFVASLRTSLLQKERPEPVVIRRVIAAFTACVARVGADIEPPGYVINDGSVFESVVRLCFTHLDEALFALLGPIKSDTNGKTQFRRWKKHSSLVKGYLHALSQFLNEVQTSSVIVCTLQAITDLLELYVNFPKLTRNITKALIRIWSRRTAECRRAAFLTLCKLVRIHKNSFSTVIKWCYLAYVTNARDVKAESWPLIVLMQKSFTELCLIYPEIAYQYAFVYIRQAAIHLRNAMIAKRTDLIQTVYNWQFIQCLYLWAQVISEAHHHCRSGKSGDATGIVELAYPLCQIVISTMKLFPSLRCLPLRMHCLRILLIIQQNCEMYIPTLALADELLSDVLLMLKKKPMAGKGTQKGVDVRCMLKASCAHLKDAGYRQAALEELFKIHLVAAHILQKSCAFPDVIVPMDYAMKLFVKNCRSTESSRLFKSLETKLKEQASYAREILNDTDMDLTNEPLLKDLERCFLASEAPLTKFYDSWQKVWKIRSRAGNQMDVKKEQPASQETEIPEEITATKRVTKRKDVEVKQSSVKEPKRKQKERAPKNISEEDVLEDLVLSDNEN